MKILIAYFIVTTSAVILALYGHNLIVRQVSLAISIILIAAFFPLILYIGMKSADETVRKDYGLSKEEYDKAKAKNRIS